MSNLEIRPGGVTEAAAAHAAPAAPVRPGVEVVEPREVPLGGPRAMTVRRTLPQRARSLVGAWCFVDHYGPDDVALTGGMQVPPHPHTGLQTVSWLFTGEVEHRDSAGHHAFVRPGELNLMTAGRGISHSEVSTPGTTRLHGVQLWVALPAATRFCEPGFEHFAPDALQGEGFAARVFLGTAFGVTSPVVTHTPLLGAEVTLEAGHRVTVPLDETFEHGLLADTGALTVDGVPLAPGRLAYLAPGRTSVEVSAPDDGPARLLLLGGPPFGERIVMWWNFVGRSHDEIAAFRATWQNRIGATVPNPADGGEDAAGEGPGDGPGDGPAVRFDLPDDDPLPPLPAPVLPNARLQPRG